MILFASLRRRSPSIFAEPDWKNAIRSDLSEHQIPEQDLYDVLALCTVLLADHDVMMANWHLDAAASARQRDELEAQGQALLAQLHDWGMRWDSDKHLKHYLKIYADLDSGQGPEGNDFAVVTFMLHKLTVVHVLQLLASLPSRNVSTGKVLGDNSSASMADQFAKDEYLAKKRQAALEACRWIQHYFRGNRNLDMRTSAVVRWTIGIIWGELRNDESTEGDWLRDLLSQKGKQVTARGLRSTYSWLRSLPEV